MRANTLDTFKVIINIVVFLVNFQICLIRYLLVRFSLFNQLLSWYVVVVRVWFLFHSRICSLIIQFCFVFFQDAKHAAMARPVPVMTEQQDTVTTLDNATVIISMNKYQ